MKAIVKFERNEFAKKVRKLYEKGELNIKRKEMKKMTIRNDGISNTLTRVTKDNMLYEDDSDMCDKRRE